MVTNNNLGNPEWANLPRKFNIAVSGSRDDYAHTHINDIGLQAIRHAETGACVYVFTMNERITFLLPFFGYLLTPIHPLVHIMFMQQARRALTSCSAATSPPSVPPPAWNSACGSRPAKCSISATPFCG